MNLTARIARWSIDHWKTATFGWLAIVIGLSVLAANVGTVPMSGIDEMNGDSKIGKQLLLDSGLEPDGSEIVLLTSTQHAADSPAMDSLARDVAQRVRDMDGVSNVRWDEPELLARDGEARMVTMDLDDGDRSLTELAEPIRTAVGKLDDRRDGIDAQQFGDGTIDGDIGEVVGGDMARAELLTAPITLAILFVTFGALVASGLPLLIGFLSVSGAISLGALLSHLMPQSEFAPNLVSMLGIALGIDYTLFILRREREERAAGHAPREALLRAAASSGTAVVISGVTVLVALSGLLASGAGMFVSMGIASMLVVLMVLLASLFVVPALLGKLGDRVERGRLPRLGRARRRAAHPKTGSGRVWGALARFAVRRPVNTMIAIGGLLLATAFPVLDMKTGDSTLAALPSTPSIDAALESEQHFPGGTEPVQLVVRANEGTLDSPRTERAIAAFERDAEERDATDGGIRSATSEDGSTMRLTVPLRSEGGRDSTDRAVRVVRDVADSTVGKLPGTTVAVTGGPAESLDFTDHLNSRLPVVFAVVLGSAFLLLMCAFRSVLVPLVAIVLNLLSVGAAYGFLVWGFQYEHLDGIIDVAGGGVVVSWMPLFLFTLLFGLSMDYHVFLVSRIREGVDHGFSTRDAIVRGVRTSASTITSAAFIMVGVFSAFALARLGEMQQMGAGLAFAILVDATVIRALLLPAVMSALGEANWYLPRWLGWLPKVSMEGREAGTLDAAPHSARAEDEQRALEPA